MDSLLIALIGAIVNGAVTWGVVSTKLAWLRADLDEARQRLNNLERAHLQLRDLAA
jgi:hypothetical protein